MLRLICACLLVAGLAGAWYTRAADAFGAAPVVVTVRESFGGDQFVTARPSLAAVGANGAAPTAAGESPIDAAAEPLAALSVDAAEAAAAPTEAELLAEANHPWTLVSGVGALLLFGATVARRVGSTARRQRA